MSAITGICDLRAISGRRRRRPATGTPPGRCRIPPPSARRSVCRVASTSAVTVVVMDCTDTGELLRRRPCRPDLPGGRRAASCRLAATTGVPSEMTSVIAVLSDLPQGGEGPSSGRAGRGRRRSVPAGRRTPSPRPCNRARRGSVAVACGMKRLGRPRLCTGTNRPASVAD